MYLLVIDDYSDPESHEIRTSIHETLQDASAWLTRERVDSRNSLSYYGPYKLADLEPDARFDSHIEPAEAETWLDLEDNSKARTAKVKQLETTIANLDRLYKEADLMVATAEKKLTALRSALGQEMSQGLLTPIGIERRQKEITEAEKLLDERQARRQERFDEIGVLKNRLRELKGLG